MSFDEKQWPALGIWGRDLRDVSNTNTRRSGIPSKRLADRNLSTVSRGRQFFPRNGEEDSGRFKRITSYSFLYV